VISGLSLLPAYGRYPAVCFYPSHAFATEEVLALCPRLSRLPRAAVREAFPPYPRGPWLRFELCCLDPSSLTTPPCASLAGTLRLHALCAYTQRLRCAGAPRRPARPSLLLLPCFPCMLPTLPRWSTVPSRYTHTVVPGFLEISASRLPTSAVSASYCRRDNLFGAASFTLCYGLQVCLALLAGYDGMKSYDLHHAF